MKQIISTQSPKPLKVLSSYHFWIIILLVGLIAVIYYTWQSWFPWFWRYFIFEYTNSILGIPFIFIPFLYASIIFWWRGSVLVWLLYIIVLVPLLIYYHPFNLGLLMRNIVFSFVPIAVVIIIALELNWRERQKKTMVEREKERQIYMAQIFAAQEDERRRIAQELHDDTTQELLALANSAQSLVNDVDEAQYDEVKKKSEWIRDGTLALAANVRRLSLDLRPSILDDIGLIPALRWLADKMNQEIAINVKVFARGTARKLPPEIEVNIFRIIQEALSNVRRHSGATAVTVTAHFHTNSVKIVIRDNGKGFLVKEVLKKLTADGKLGIVGMQQRARFMSGTFNILSKLGEGTSIVIELADQPA